MGSLSLSFLPAQDVAGSLDMSGEGYEQGAGFRF